MPFGLWTQVGPQNHMVVQIARGDGATFGGKDMPADLSPLMTANRLVCCRRYGGIIACRGRVHSLPRGVVGLVNMIQQSVCGNDVAFCQITFTTCLKCD